MAPDSPVVPSNVNALELVVFDWVAPVNNGITITSYTVMIRKSDNLFAEDLDYCNGALADIVAATECTIPMSTLTSAPFNLVLDDSIDFIVQAHNLYGSSEFSPLGAGALI
jgi:hypothetical protein